MTLLQKRKIRLLAKRIIRNDKKRKLYLIMQKQNYFGLSKAEATWTILLITVSSIGFLIIKDLVGLIENLVPYTVTSGVMLMASINYKWCFRSLGKIPPVDDSWYELGTFLIFTIWYSLLVIITSSYFITMVNWT